MPGKQECCVCHASLGGIRRDGDPDHSIRVEYGYYLYPDGISQWECLDKDDYCEQHDPTTPEGQDAAKRWRDAGRRKDVKANKSLR